MADIPPLLMAQKKDLSPLPSQTILLQFIANVHVCIHPPHSLLLSILFFPINWLLPQSPDLWVILFNHVYIIQVQSSSIKGVCWN